MEFGVWSAPELQRLWQSLAANCEALAPIASQSGSRGEAATYARGFLAALTSSALAIGIASPQIEPPVATGERPQRRRAPRRAPPPPGPWYAEDLGDILQGLAAAADHMALAMDPDGEDQRLLAFVSGFQGALCSAARALGIPPPRVRARVAGHARDIRHVLRQLLPTSPIGTLPWQRGESDNPCR